MSIRRLFLLITFGFVFIAFATAIALVQITTKMTSLTELSQQQMDSVRVSEELQISLLKFSRETLRYFRLGQMIPEQERFAYERRAMDRIREVEPYVDSAEEGELLTQIRDSVEEYFSAHSKFTQLENEGLVRIRSLPPIFDRTLQLSEDFTSLNVLQAEQLRAEITKIDDQANFIAAIFFTLCVIAFVFAIYVIRHFVVLPISRLNSELIALSKSNRLTQVHEEGPFEIRAIASAFNKLADQVLSQRETALRFLAGVAHDLRNPLGAIRMSSELLSDEQTSVEERQGIVQIISRQAQQLDRMVGDLLDTTRIETGQLDIKAFKVPIARIVEEAVRLHRPVSQVHTIDLMLPGEDLFVNADVLRISQVLNNLLNNAIKYSPNGGIIRVEVSKRQSNVVVDVSDQGLGIAKEDQKTIFEPFRRTQATKLTIPGVGLGLSVSKRIIEAHDGIIEVISCPGEGSTFRLILPLAEKSNQKEAPQELILQ